MGNFALGSMHVLIVLATVFATSRAGVVRVPKVYNALITSDDNLTPSQVYPFTQTVVRPPPPFGYASYPYHPVIIGPTILEQKPKVNPKKNKDDGKKETSTLDLELQEETTTVASKDDDDVDKSVETDVNLGKPNHVSHLAPLNPLHFPGSIYPLDPVFTPYSSWATTHELFFPPAPVPYYHHTPLFIDLSHITPGKAPKINTNHKPKDAAIPDVPPPSLSKTGAEVKDQTKRKA